MEESRPKLSSDAALKLIEVLSKRASEIDGHRAKSGYYVIAAAGAIFYVLFKSDATSALGPELYALRCGGAVLMIITGAWGIALSFAYAEEFYLLRNQADEVLKGWLRGRSRRHILAKIRALRGYQVGGEFDPEEVPTGAPS